MSRIRRFLSLFSGIDAASVAWTPLGWEAAAFSEIEPFPCAVLNHHYPTVPNLGDVSGIDGAALDPLGPIDLAVFGWPCQDLSVAGKRAGLVGQRSGLFYEATRIVRLAAERGCRWFVAENVPGLLSSHRGQDFSAVLREITGLDLAPPREGWGNSGVAAVERGWSCAWRVLDAQYFGVPQRRRRVFLVGHLGDWRRCVSVLFEPESLSGDPPPRREAEQDVARCLANGTNPHRFDGDTENFVAGCLNSGGNSGGFRTEPGEHLTVAATAGALTGRPYSDNESRESLLVASTLFASNGGVSSGYHPVVPVPFNWRQDDVSTKTASPALGTRDSVAIAYIVNAAESCAKQSHARPAEASRCLDGTGGFASSQGGTVVGTRSAVRRLTPTECERLMGLPDGYTDVPYKGKAAKDGNRYKALGNSMAVPVMRWLGRRIQIVEALP